MKAGGKESKGTVTYKMELGGLWLAGAMESELFGQKFTGKSLDTYDPAKKKYVGVWVDSMSTAPVTMEGTYDKEKKTLTMAGEGPGHGRQADQVQVGVRDAGRRHRGDDHVHRRRQGADVHRHLQAEEVAAHARPRGSAGPGFTSDAAGEASLLVAGLRLEQVVVFQTRTLSPTRSAITSPSRRRKVRCPRSG